MFLVSLLCIVLLLSDPFAMLTRNAKASMNSTGKDTDSSSTKFVSLATLREMLKMQEQMFKDMFEFVSLATLREMLKMQERMFKDVFEQFSVHLGRYRE